MDRTKNPTSGKYKMKLQPINAYRQRNNPPLRTALEFCEEFGVTMAQLRGMLAAHDAPEPKLRHRGKAYYRPNEMRKWWKSLAQSKAID